MEARIPLAVIFGNDKVNKRRYNIQSLIDLKNSEYVQTLLKDRALYLRTDHGDDYNPCTGLNNIIGYIKEWNELDALVEITNHRAIEFFNTHDINDYLVAMSYWGELDNESKNWHLSKLAGAYLIRKDNYKLDPELMAIFL